MKTRYSIPRQIWRAIYPMLIFLGVQMGVGALAGACYVVSILLARGSLDPLQLVSQLQQWLVGNGVLLTLLADAVCLAPFIPIWRKTCGQKARFRSQTGAVRVAVFVFLAFIGLNLLLSSIFAITDVVQYFPSYNAVENTLSSGGIVVQTLTLVIVGPLVEEMCFRGITLNRMLSWTPAWLAVLVQAALFGIAHLNLFQGLYAFVLGIALGFLYVRFRKFWVCVAGHLAFNLTSVAAGFLLENSDVSWWVSLLPGAALFVICGVVLFRFPAAVPVQMPGEAPPPGKLWE